MATVTIKGGIPFLSLDSGMGIRFVAIDAATGLEVGGVVVTNVAVYGTDLAAAQLAQPAPPTLSTGFLPG